MTATASKTMPRTRTYRIVFERDEADLWTARVQGIAGCHTQGRTLAQARERIREALALFDERADTARFDEHVRLPAVANRLVRAQRLARSKHAALDAQLRELNVKAARALAGQLGLSLRDTGELLGVSQESVRQWLA
jgi:predicted RNase H-like HicB family nuclease